MKSLQVFDATVYVNELESPKSGDECLVRVTLSGICNTDLEIARGYGGFSGTIGHEFVGIVEQCGSDSDLVGRRVVGEINVGCGRCDVCSSGDQRHCPLRTVLGIKGRDGAHADILRLPARNLIPIADTIADHQAVFVEPLAAALAITEQVEIRPETKVAVVGDGKLGLLCARSLAEKSRHVYAVGKHREKLRLAKIGGAEGILLADAHKIRGQCDVVVEASGSESGFQVAAQLVRPRGKIVLKSTFQGTAKWETSRVVVDELTIIGSRCGRFEPALEMLERGAIDVADLISEEYPLEHGVTAMKRAAEPGVMKVLLRPN